MTPPDGRASRTYERLLGCYPRAFRDRFAAGMHEAFAREHAAAAARGRTALVRFWCWTAADAVRFGLAARRRPPAAALPRPDGGAMRSVFTVDLGAALKSLRATPVVTTIAVVSLALGIGANTALFSILDGLVLKPLPVRDPSALAVIDGGSWTNPIWEQLRAHRHEVWDDAFAWSATRFNLSAHGETDFVDGAWASGGMFDVLGVHAALGRLLSDADDDRSGGRDGPAAVVSDGFWRQRLGGAADVVGRHLTINGLAFTIVGVMPPGFYGPDVGRSADVIVPIGVRALMPNGPRILDGRSVWWLEIMIRRRAGQTLDEAATALEALRPQVRAATTPQNWSATDRADYLAKPWALIPAATGESDLRASYRTPLEVVLVVVGAVLLVACANLANLLLARAADRRRELGVRLALGASRFRLAKQLLAESAMLAATGAALGLVVARWAGALLLAQIGTTVALDVSLDGRVLAFTIGVAAVTAIAFGLAPALGVSRVAPQEVLREHSRSVTGERRFGLRNLLVVGQVALSLALVVGAALFLRTLGALVAAPTGLDTTRLLTADVNAAAVPLDRDARLAQDERLRAAAADVPGVSRAALSVMTPLGNFSWNTAIEPRPGTAALPVRERLSEVNVVAPGWFGTVGVRVVSGRDFDAGDVHGAARVAVVSEAFVRRFLAPGPAVGQTFRTGLEGPRIDAFEVVGVVSDTVYLSLRRGLEPVVYTPLAQLDDMQNSVVVTTRIAAGPAAARVHDVSTALAQADPRVSFTVRAMDEQVTGTLRQERLVALLAGFFGGLALLLAAIGLYGVTSHAVGRRRAEIGIRMALGADRRSVVRLVLARVGGLLTLGVAAGLALSWWASHFVQALLFGLGPRDPRALAGAAAMLVVVGLVAGWVPARRAARIDPVEVLRDV